MPRPRKFEPGEPITSIAEMDAQLARDGYVFLFHDRRPTHAAVVQSQRYRTLQLAIAQRRMKRAMLRDEWVEWTEKNEAALR